MCVVSVRILVSADVLLLISQKVVEGLMFMSEYEVLQEGIKVSENGETKDLKYLHCTT